jgi:YD repeat-containing protein
MHGPALAAADQASDAPVELAYDRAGRVQCRFAYDRQPSRHLDVRPDLATEIEIG